METPNSTMVETKRRRKRVNVGDIPHSLLVDIFSRLPISTILNCRIVCKAWYSCLSSLEYSRAYQSKSSYISLLQYNSSKYHLVEYGHDEDDDKEISYKTLRMPPQLTRSETSIVGSCNGVVCFLSPQIPRSDKILEGSWGDNLDLYVGNPLLGEYYCLPQPIFKHKMGKILRETFGFGYSLSTNHYKVLRVLQLEGENQKNAEIQVLTIGVDEDWRVLGYKVPLPQHVNVDRWGSIWKKHRFGEFITFGGAIHWIHVDEETVDFIYSFDIATERVQTLPPPPDFGNRNRLKSLTVFRDCLCLLTFDNSHIAIWSMKQYGVSESWSKEIFWRIFIGNLSFELYPIGIWRNGEMLFRSRLYTFFSYDPIRKQYELLRTHSCIKVCVYATPYVPSFVHLDDAMKVAGDKEKRELKGIIWKLKISREHTAASVP